MNREADVEQKKRKNNANYYCRNDYFFDVNMTQAKYGMVIAFFSTK